MVAEYEALWAALDIAPDAFIRTTDEEHAVRGCVVCGVWLGGGGGGRTGKERETGRGRGRGINGWIRRVEWNDLDDLDDVRFHASMHEDGRTDSRTQYTLHLYPTFLEPTPQHPVSLYLKIHSPLPPSSSHKQTHIQSSPRSTTHPDLQIYGSPPRRTLRLHPPLYFYLPPSLP